MPMHNCLIVADSSRARIFHVASLAGDWREVAGLGHPSSRSRRQDLVADRSGRTFDRSGRGRHAMEDRQDVRSLESQHFASEVAAYLQRQERAAQRIGVIAPPKFLGRLRQQLKGGERAKLRFTVDKNLVTQPAAAIRRQAPKRWPTKVVD